MNIFDFVQFDEGRFPAVSQGASNYHSFVQEGYERMRHATVVIAGLARNVAHILPATILRAESLGKAFRNYHIVIYENDSSDHTRELLETWAELNPRVSLVCEKLEAPVNRPIRCSSRAKWMAYYRNSVQQYILNHIPKADYVVLLDTDLIGGWSPDGIANTIGQDDWDFVGSNGIIYKRLGLSSNHLVHYDAWAFRLDEAMTPMTTSEVNAIEFKRGQALQPVYSCFGGLGIYTYDAYANGVYEGEDIEHVGFHRSLIAKGYDRIYLNPSQIVVYGRKHRRFDKYFRTIQSSFPIRQIFGCEPWKFQRRIDFSHWGANQLRQMLESSENQYFPTAGISNAA